MSNNQSRYIYYAFPEDYSQLDSMLTVKGNKIIARDTFCVHPECDLPYKLLSMIYSKIDRVENINKLNKIANNPWLKIHTKERTKGQDYMLQMYGIDSMFGIKRDFKIGVPEEKSEDKVINIDKFFEEPKFYQIDEVIQTPILFLILVWQKLSEDMFVKHEMIDIINKAITAYDQEKQNNYFNTEQLEWCHRFLLEDDFMSNKYGAIINRCIYARVENDIEERIDEIVNKYLHDCLEVESVKISYDKGESISFPKYMRSIIIGIYDRYDCMEFIRPSVWNDTGSLWSMKNIHLLKGIDEEKVKIFWKYQYYLQYQRQSDRLHIPSWQEEELKSYIEEKLLDYYTFCVYTLYIMSKEKEEFKNLALDAFERLFSLYLFDKETKLLYQKVEEVAAKLIEYSIQKSESELKLDLVKYIFNNFSSEIVHAIYCSPGIHHRVSLAEYINQIDISIDDFLKRYITYENDSIYYGSTGDRLLKKISKINQDYYSVENYLIHTGYCKDKDSTLLVGEIKEKYERCREQDEYVKYYEDNFWDEISELSGADIKYIKNYAKKKAKDIIENDNSVEKSIIRFWVIFSSFSSKDSLVKLV